MDFLKKTTDGTYEVSMRVPTHLRPTLMRSNLTRRLGTKIKAEAKRLASAHVAQFQKLLGEAELGGSAPPALVDVMEALRAIDGWAAAERQ
jgi:hypothetical protein